MKIAQAKEYFDLGVITRFYAVRDLNPSAWLLCIEGREGRSWTLQTSKGESKVFSSLDTLAGEISKITGRVTSVIFTL